MNIALSIFVVDRWILSLSLPPPSSFVFSWREIQSKLSFPVVIDGIPARTLFFHGFGFFPLRSSIFSNKWTNMTKWFWFCYSKLARDCRQEKVSSLILKSFLSNPRLWPSLLDEMGWRGKRSSNEGERILRRDEKGMENNRDWIKVGLSWT